MFDCASQCIVCRPEVFCRKGFLRNFGKFTGKHLCHSLFLSKVAGLKPATLLKKRLWHSCFAVNFAKFLRTPFFTEYLWWLLLYVSTHVSTLRQNVSCVKFMKSIELDIKFAVSLILKALLTSKKIKAHLNWVNF